MNPELNSFNLQPYKPKKQKLIYKSLSETKRTPTYSSGAHEFNTVAGVVGEQNCCLPCEQGPFC
jgi:hypothetical protein